MTTITIDRTLLVRMEKELFLARNYGGILRDEPLLNEVSAALSAPATAPDLSAAYIGAREDLAVWKKRALEAEETARQLNRALAEEVNGPTFMGEPVLPATAQAAEIERLKTESEERLKNAVALVAEVERLRKDAERYQWLAEYLVSDDESYDDAIVAATTVKEVDSVIDNAMKGTS